MKLLRQLRHLTKITVEEMLCNGECDSCPLRFRCYTENSNGSLLIHSDEEFAYLAKSYYGVLYLR